MTLLQVSTTDYRTVSTVLAILVILSLIYAIYWTIKQAREAELPTGDFISSWAVWNLRSVVVLSTLILGTLEAILSASTPGYSPFGLGHMNHPVRFGLHLSLSLLSAFFLIALPLYLSLLMNEVFEYITHLKKKGVSVKTVLSQGLIRICLFLLVTALAAAIGFGLPVYNLTVIASGLKEWDTLAHIWNQYGFFRMSNMEAYYKATIDHWCEDYTVLLPSCPYPCPDDPTKTCYPKSASTDLLASMGLTVLHYMLDVFLGFNALLMTPDIVKRGWTVEGVKDIHRKIDKNAKKADVTANPEEYIKKVLKRLNLNNRRFQDTSKQALENFRALNTTDQSKVSAWLADRMEDIEYFDKTEKATLTEQQQKEKTRRLRKTIYDFFRKSSDNGKGLGCTIRNYTP